MQATRSYVNTKSFPTFPPHPNIIPLHASLPTSAITDWSLVTDIFQCYYFSLLPFFSLAIRGKVFFILYGVCLCVCVCARACLFLFAWSMEERKRCYWIHFTDWLCGILMRSSQTNSKLRAADVPNTNTRGPVPMFSSSLNIYRL